MFKKCNICGKEFRTHKSEFERRKSCSKKCHYIWRSKITKGIPKSEEHKRKIGLANKGKKRLPFSKEWRANLSKARKGKKFSKEHRENISKAQRGEKGNNWKGGKFIHDGYIYISQHSHPRVDKKGYVKRCILVMEKYLRRFLTSKEIVHHDGTKFPKGSLENKSDDRIKNLKLFANHSEHMKYHHSHK